MAANLAIKATLGGMRRLGADEEIIEALERAGHEPTTTVEELEGRDGYQPSFLDGWTIPLPLAINEREEDMLPLRRGGTGVELKYRHFSTIQSRSRRMPLLTAVNIDASKSRRLPRINVWSYDGRLDKEDQWGDSLYDNNVADRGHMVRREDPVWGSLEEADEANVDTFHFTNSCPQMAGVNQQTWLGLENYILANARADRMRVSVFTGPMFSDLDLPYRGALIPLAFWKVVAIVTEEDRPSATAYKVSQRKELEELEFVYAGYKTFQISIRQVIDATSFDFHGLVQYDGFSRAEAESGESLVEELESLKQVRI